MGWIKQRTAALNRSLGPRRYLLIPLAGVVITFMDWVFARLTEAGISYFFGWPVWVTGLIAALVLVAYWLLDSVVKLQSQLTPKLELSFNPNPDGGGIIKTPEKARDPRTGKVVEEWETVYVRVRVETSTAVAVEQCTAFLVTVAKESDDFKQNRFFDPIQLPWSLTTVGEIQIYKGVPRHIDVLKANSKQNKLELPNPSIWPLTLRGYFDDTTTYRAGIIVVGGRISKSIEIDVQWNGDWQKLTAKRVDVNPR